MSSGSKLQSSKVILGRNVYQLRLRLGLTQEKLAERALIDRRYVQRIEAGTANPGIVVLARLVAALECQWQEIVKGISIYSD